jgi:hypothetical protein
MSAIRWLIQQIDLEEVHITSLTIHGHQETSQDHGNGDKRAPRLQRPEHQDHHRPRNHD